MFWIILMRTASLSGVMYFSHCFLFLIKRLNGKCNTVARSINPSGPFTLYPAKSEKKNCPFVWSSVQMSVSSHTRQTLYCSPSCKSHKKGPEWKPASVCVLGKASWNQPICESPALCNSLPLSRNWMYLSNHLNYYNRCWDRNACLSALTLWNF